MTSGHFIFIPGMIMIGFVLGFIFGGRAARDAFAMERRKEEERAATKAAREAKKQATAEKPPA